MHLLLVLLQLPAPSNLPLLHYFTPNSFALAHGMIHATFYMIYLKNMHFYFMLDSGKKKKSGKEMRAVHI